MNAFEYWNLAAIVTYHFYQNYLQVDLAIDFGYEITDEMDLTVKEIIQKSIQEDYTKVDVYFQTLNVKSIIQSALYPVSQNFKNKST